LVALLAKLKQEWTLLVVTHDAGDLLAIADKCWQIDRGKLTEANLLNGKLVSASRDNS
jgi:energy-coupling factor transport system ATP-binding protein